jgi:hypothetical protein
MCVLFLSLLPPDFFYAPVFSSCFIEPVRYLASLGRLAQKLCPPTATAMGPHKIVLL